MPIVTAIRRWLEGAFPESNVRMENDQARNLSRFLIEERAGGRARVFEVSAVGLQSDPDGIVRYLSDQGVDRRLRDDPAWRARLGPGNTLEYFQQLHVRCDGRSYYVLQTSDRRTMLVDARYVPLTRTPPADAWSSGDIAATPTSQWQERIRAWRGADQ